MVAAARIENEVTRAYRLLGGKKTIKGSVDNALDAHDLLVKGLPTSTLLHLVNEVLMLSSEDALEKAIGISLRTLQRRKKDNISNALSVDQSNRTWRFAEIFGRAIGVLGSKEEAERWMTQPAIGLENRKPIDLLATAAGAEAVENHLTRLSMGFTRDPSSPPARHRRDQILAH